MCRHPTEHRRTASTLSSPRSRRRVGCADTHVPAGGSSVDVELVTRFVRWWRACELVAGRRYRDRLLVVCVLGVVSVVGGVLLFAGTETGDRRLEGVSP
jgi:hypothetical protein